MTSQPEQINITIHLASRIQIISVGLNTEFQTRKKKPAGLTADISLNIPS